LTIFGVTNEVKLKSNSEPRKPLASLVRFAAAPAGFRPETACQCGAD
jgi:hypothetical protein